MYPMRLAKFIAINNICSRRVAEAKIADGEVKVNGLTVVDVVTFIDVNDIVDVDGIILSHLRKDVRVWLYYKPRGLVVTRNDENGRRTIFDEIEQSHNFPNINLISIGRLDIESEGLLLLTNDGEYARSLELPSNKVQRKYKVRAFGLLFQEDIELISSRVTIDGITYNPIAVSLSANQSIKYNKRGNYWFDVVLEEGKNREIRKLFEYIGMSISRLIRVSYGEFNLGNMYPNDLIELPKRVI